MRTEEDRLSGVGTRRVATQWRSRAQPGLPGTRAGLAGSAAHSRATGRGHQPRRRASGDRSASQRRSRRRRKNGPRPARSGQRCRVGIRRPRRHLSTASRNRAHRPTERPACLRGRHRAPHPGRLRSRPAVCVLSPAPSGQRTLTRASRSSPPGRDPATGLGGEKLASSRRARSRRFTGARRLLPT